MNPNFWRGKKVFLTGHTGFKGAWLSLWLQKMGAHVCAYALPPMGETNLFSLAQVSEGMQSIFGDIRDYEKLKSAMSDFQPEIVIHMAAQALVRYSYENPLETYAVNVMGTAHVLEAARHIKNLRALVNVTSDKCYENREWVWGYREDEAMGGFDPYSSSKGCAELVSSAYRRSFFENAKVGVASARAGNVIGGGDWAKDRLIPDIIQACFKGEKVKIRYPNAIRPWQHVLEPLSGYLLLAEKLFTDPQKFSSAWNFGPAQSDAKPVQWIVEKMLKSWKENAGWELESEVQSHEAHYLKLDCAKASSEMSWQPRWDLEEALSNTVSWYKAHAEGQNMRNYSFAQIETYQFL